MIARPCRVVVNTGPARKRKSVSERDHRRPRRTLALICRLPGLCWLLACTCMQGLEPCPMCIVQRYALIGSCGRTGKPQRPKVLVD